jgi:hypothetical protein
VHTQLLNHARTQLFQSCTACMGLLELTSKPWTVLCFCVALVCKVHRGYWWGGMCSCCCFMLRLLPKASRGSHAPCSQSTGSHAYLPVDGRPAAAAAALSCQTNTYTPVNPGHQPSKLAWPRHDQDT